MKAINPYRRLWGPTPRYKAVRESSHLLKAGWITIAGPCSVETREQIYATAERVAVELSPTYFRGGITRLGTYRYYAPDRVEDAIRLGWLLDAASANKMGAIVEIHDIRMLDDKDTRDADAYQVGARHMQDYALLEELAHTKKPVFLKRNMGSTLDEFLGAAERLCSRGNQHVALIERGSSTYHNHVRWELSVSMIAAVKRITGLPILVDASHGSGRNDLVEPLTLAGIAAGANGFLIEVHLDPEHSFSDSDQAIDIETAKRIFRKSQEIQSVVKEVTPCKQM